jgi:hypothetical protein
MRVYNKFGKSVESNSCDLILGYYPFISPERLKKVMKTPQDCQCPGRHSIRSYPEYKSVALPLLFESIRMTRFGTKGLDITGKQGLP